MDTRICKTVVIGDPKSGQSSLILKYADNYFTENSLPGLGMDYKVKTQELEGNTIRNQIFDNPLKRGGHLQGAHAVVVTVDMTNPNSLQNLQHKWLDHIQRLGPENVIIVVAATKCDKTANQEINENDLRDILKQLSIPYMRVSSKTGEGLEELFTLVHKEYLSKVCGVTLTNTRELDTSMADWHQNPKYKSMREEYEQVWNKAIYKTNKERIIACMNYYTKDNSALSRMFSGVWRTHAEEVAAICTASKVRTDMELLKDLKAIDLKTKQGDCAVMIELIEEKLTPSKASIGVQKNF